MAIVKQPQAARLVIKVETGVNAQGKPVTRMRNFKNVKPEAADADIYAIGQALSELQKYPVVSVERVDDSKLVSQ